MDLLFLLIDMVLHFDNYLPGIIATYGFWTYLILFAIIFCETGLVVMPFLPGDSLLFVAGALAATGGMDISALIVVLLLAAVLGDNSNYWIGRWFGLRVLHWGEGTSRLFNRNAYDRAHAFYERWGGATMVLARFIPLVRTFAPFVAGVARMTYLRYFLFDLFGAMIWVGSLSLAGYWFGNLPLVRDNLSVVILGIVGFSLLPVLAAAVKQRLAR